MNQKKFLVLVAVIIVSVLGYARTKKSRSVSKRASHAKMVKSSSGSLRFNNCTEARKRGYTNIRKGQPGYAPLDRDRDGIACESK